MLRSARTAATTSTRVSAVGLGSGIVANAQLAPKNFWSLRQRQDFVHKRRQLIGGTKDIDHIDLRVDIGKPSIDLLAMDLLAGMARIDRNDPVALVEQEAHHAKTRARRIGGGPDHGDGLDRLQDGADLFGCFPTLVLSTATGLR